MKNLNKLKNACGRLANMMKRAAKYAVTTACICLLALAVLKLPEIQNKWLHHKVGSKVYMIRDSARSGGGTGFAIKAPSGESYILTNDHVCGVSSDGRTVLVTGDQGSMRRNIISHDENSDLCLIEGMPGVEGLKTASIAPSLGDTVSVVGHPRLMPTHVSQGEVTGSETISIPLGPISVVNPQTGETELVSPQRGGIPAEQCTMNKHSQVDVDIDMMFFQLKVKFCVMTVHDAYITSVTIHPGNSGSPMVNFWGNVVGVAFASDGDTNWGRIVPLQDVKAFLSNY